MTLKFPCEPCLLLLHGLRMCRDLSQGLELWAKIIQKVQIILLVIERQLVQRLAYAALPLIYIPEWFIHHEIWVVFTYCVNSLYDLRVQKK